MNARVLIIGELLPGLTIDDWDCDCIEFVTANCPGGARPIGRVFEARSNNQEKSTWRQRAENAIQNLRPNLGRKALERVALEDEVEGAP